MSESGKRCNQCHAASCLGTIKAFSDCQTATLIEFRSIDANGSMTTMNDSNQLCFQRSKACHRLGAEVGKAMRVLYVDTEHKRVHDHPQAGSRHCARLAQTVNRLERI